MGRVTLTSRFPEIIGTLPRKISADLKEGAEQVLENSTERINTITGETEESGSVKGGAGEYRVEYEAYWAHWVEFGRKNAPPYPFLLPALEEEAPEILAKVHETLNSL